MFRGGCLITKNTKNKTKIIEAKQTKITDWYNKLLDDLWELAQTKVIEFNNRFGEPKEHIKKNYPIKPTDKRLKTPKQ